MRVFSKNENSVLHSLIGFDELCNDELFYEKLFEGDENTLRICYRRKKELEEEFNDKKDEDDLDPDWWEKLK